MLDVTTLIPLAIPALVHLLQTALDKGAEEVGKAAAVAAIDKLRKRLRHAGSTEVLEDLSKQPEDTATQSALAYNLRKAAAEDPGLSEFLAQWIQEARPDVAISQTANVRGDNNRTTQIAGSGNRVG